MEKLSDNVKSILSYVKKAEKMAGRKDGSVTVLAATKTRTPAEIAEAVKSGITDIGENRVQELLSKYDDIKDLGANIHFIGVLQTNKVKYIIDKVCLIHSVTGEKLAAEIDRQAKKADIVMDILIEVNIGNEQTKSGISADEVSDFAEKLQNYSNIRLRGLMAIPPFDLSEKQQVDIFSQMYKLFIDIKTKYCDNINLDILSMGMSHDFVQAVICGSTMVRIGTALFGERIYNKEGK